jgi:VWFA-related protein
MKRRTLLFTFLACTLPLFAQSGDFISASTVVTAMPKNSEAANLQRQNIKVWADNKKSQVTAWQPFQGDRAGLEFIVLVDDSARQSIGLQFNDLAKFLQSLPPTALTGVAYMQNGRAAFAQNLTNDHTLAAKALRQPQGVPGGNASPYFCLSDLAKHWPSQDPKNRREVLMITDGFDPYYPRYDPQDPYLQAAISDAQKAGIIVYSIYYRNAGRFSSTMYATNAGQNLLTQLTDATGGRLYWQGLSNPVSFQPFLDDLGKRLENQYELGFSVPARSKAELVSLKVKTDANGINISAPQRVSVGGAAQ